MTRTIKLILIIAAGVLVLGLAIVCLAVFFMDGLRSTGDRTAHTQSFPADLSAIYTDLSSASIRVHRTDGDEIVVSWYDTENHRIRAEATGGRLEICMDVQNRPWYAGIGLWGFDVSNHQVEIGIPADFTGALELNGSSGNMTLEDLDLRRGLALSLTSGDVTLWEVNCAEDLRLSFTSGDVTLREVSCAGDLGLSFSSGGVQLTDVSAAGRLSIDGTSGGITGQDVDCGDFWADGTSGRLKVSRLQADTVYARLTSGNLSLEDMDAAHSICLETTSGRIRCSVPDAISAYSIRSGTTSGSCDLPSQADYGAKQLEVHATSGDIKFQFGQ